MARPPRRPERAVVLLNVAFTLAMATMAAGIVHLIPYLVDHGWTPVLAAVAAGTLGATQVAARVASGPAARRTTSANLATVILGLPAVGVVVLAFSDGNWTAWIAVAVLGAAQGTATLLRPMLLARLNGPDGYGRLAATSAATTTIARATAPADPRHDRRCLQLRVRLHPVRPGQHGCGTDRQTRPVRPRPDRRL